MIARRSGPHAASDDSMRLRKHQKRCVGHIKKKADAWLEFWSSKSIEVRVEIYINWCLRHETGTSSHMQPYEMFT